MDDMIESFRKVIKIDCRFSLRRFMTSYYSWIYVDYFFLRRYYVVF